MRIHDLGSRKRFLHLGLELSLPLFDVAMRERPVTRGIRLDLGRQIKLLRHPHHESRQVTRVQTIAQLSHFH